MPALSKRRLVFGALLSEICLAFPVSDSLEEGFEVMFVEDVCCGETPVAHKAAISRITQAGPIANSAIGLSSELFRNWASAEAHVAKPIIEGYLAQVRKWDLH